MLSAFLYDRAEGKAVEDWQPAAASLTASQVLWIDLLSPSQDEQSEVSKALRIGEAYDHHRSGRFPEAQVHLHPEYIHVTSMIAAPDDTSTELCALESLVGHNWVVTIHDEKSPLVEAFKELAAGPSQIGTIDAACFLATLLDLVVISYIEEFEKIEADLERFDADVLATQDSDFESKVEELLKARERLGALRRALAPHRRVYGTLSHAELDQVSTEESAARFRHLADEVDDAVGRARDAKEAVMNSFDMLVLRTETRTNDIVKVLTLASILLLPGTLIAGVMGMNINLAGSEFVTSGLFWGSVAAIVVIAGTTLYLAHARRWI